MADEPNENDDEFLSYLTRVGSKWPGLTELIDQRIAEAQKKTHAGGSPAGSTNYLEQQNRLLLEMLLKRDTPPLASDQPTPAPSANEPLKSSATQGVKPSDDTGPKKQPSPTEPKKAFWR